MRSPDVSWISLNRWNSLNKQQKRGFARGLQAPELNSGDSPSPINPDFVIELVSPTDDVKDLQKKMTEYMSCGVKLGWLINPDRKQAEIYRVDKDKEVLNNPCSLSGETILPNLTINLSNIF